MEFMFFVFLVWMAFAVGVGYLASARGRSGAGWGFLSLLVSPVICLIALLLLPDLVAEAVRKAREERRDKNNQLELLKTKAIAERQLEVLSSLAESEKLKKNGHSAPFNSPSLIADELQKLLALRESGVLTSDEFGSQKARLLKMADGT